MTTPEEKVYMNAKGKPIQKYFKSILTAFLPPIGDCVIIAGEGERQSGSKDLECGSFREWETVVRIMSNVFI